MREPSLKETALASVLIHALIFFIATISLKRSSHYTFPKTYTVKLISSEKKTPLISSVKKKKAKKSTLNLAKIRSIKEQRRQKMISMKKSFTARKKKEVSKTEPLDTSHVQQQIEKLRALKRIKRLAALKHEVLSISRTNPAKETKSSEESKPADNSTKAGPSDAVVNTYINMARQKIWSQWVLPEIKDIEGLETIVIIKVLKDGKLKIEGIEKASGDTLFDRSALRAIMKASPLPPPPEELELGIRFQP